MSDEIGQWSFPLSVRPAYIIQCQAIYDLHLGKTIRVITRGKEVFRSHGHNSVSIPQPGAVTYQNEKTLFVAGIHGEEN